MKIVNKVSAHNEFDIIIKDGITQEEKAHHKAYNLITDYGMGQILQFNDTWFQYIAFGSGDGEVLTDDNELFSQIGYKTAEDYEVNKAFPTSSWTRKITIGTSEYIGEEFKEVGIGYNSYMRTKAIIQDSDGFPISIVKTDTDVIEIYATVYIVLDETSDWLTWHDVDTNYLVQTFTDYSHSSQNSLEEIDTMNINYQDSLITTLDANSYGYSVADDKCWFNRRIDVNDANQAIDGIGIKNIFDINLLDKLGSGFIVLEDEEFGVVGDDTTVTFNVPFWTGAGVSGLVVKLNDIETTDYTLGEGTITFDTAPVLDAIATFSGVLDYIPKDVNHVVDITTEINYTREKNFNSFYIYSGSFDDTVKKINANVCEAWTFTGHSDYVTAIAADSDGNVYSGSFDDTVKKIDSSGDEVWTFTGHNSNVNAVAVDADGNVYSGSYDHTVKKIDSNGNEVWTFTGHSDFVNAVAVDADGNVYSGSDDSTVKKIDSSGNEVWTFTGHSSFVNAVSVDADGNVYSGSYDHTVKKIDSSGNEVWTFTGHSSHVRAVAVDSDGNVYSGSYDNTVKKIDSSGNEVWTFTGHSGFVNAVAVDADGNVYSGSYDHTVKKIDSNGNEVWTFTGHSNAVYAVATIPGL